MNTLRVQASEPEVPALKASGVWHARVRFAQPSMSVRIRLKHHCLAGRLE